MPWDAVELPSQFLENWCWQEEALAFISGHYQTGEPLPKVMLDKMLAAKNFQSAMFILRQLELGLFDFTLHTTYDQKWGQKCWKLGGSEKESGGAAGLGVEPLLAQL